MGTGSSSRRSNMSRRRRVSRKKAILQIASGYVVGWALVWVPGLLLYFLPIFRIKIIASLVTPMQGLINLIVFMSPKLRVAARRGQRRGDLVSWTKVVSQAFMSRGERRIS